MTEIRSLIIKQELIGRLQQNICCSDSQETCRDGAFCSSDASKWPYIQNGHKKVRISYPRNSETEALPGTVNFCSEYMDWYTKSGCGSLAKEIAQNISEQNNCPVSANMDNLINPILRKTYKSQRKKIEKMLREGAKKMTAPYSEQCSESYSQMAAIKESMLKRCAIMYDGEVETATFNPDRADDLENIANFCMIVQKAEETKFDWKTFVKGGGAVGGFYIAVKTIKGILSAGKYISWAGTGLDTINQGIKHLFYVSIPNLKNTIVSIFTGKKPAPTKTDADIDNIEEKKTPEEIPPVDEPISTDKINISNVLKSAPRPHADVVMAQFSNLINSSHYKSEGEMFSKFTQKTQNYMVSLALRQWIELTPLKQARLIADDSRFTEGKLPIDFLLKFARRYLNEKMLPINEKSAIVWSERSNKNEENIVAPQAHSNFHPRFSTVFEQLISNNPLGRESSHVLDYITYKAINRWNELSAQRKESFIAKSDNPSDGALPKNYIRSTRKHSLRNLKVVRREAAVFAQILKRVPYLAEESFDKIEARSNQLINIWNNLSNEIRDGFISMNESSVMLRNPSSLPSSYIEGMRPSLEMGLRKVTKSIHVDEMFWEYELSGIINSLSQYNQGLLKYREMLKNTAISIVETWIDLPDSMKDIFLKESEGGSKIGSKSKTIPRSFLELHSKIAKIIEIAPNKNKKPGDDNGNNQSPPQNASGSAPTTSGSSAPSDAAFSWNGPIHSEKARYVGIIPHETFTSGGINMLEAESSNIEENLDIVNAGTMMFSNSAIIGTMRASSGAARGN